MARGQVLNMASAVQPLDITPILKARDDKRYRNALLERQQQTAAADQAVGNALLKQGGVSLPTGTTGVTSSQANALLQGQKTLSERDKANFELVGSALEWIESLPENQRQQAYQQVRQNASQMGVDISKVPPTYDPGFTQPLVAMYRKTKTNLTTKERDYERAKAEGFQGTFIDFLQMGGERDTRTAIQKNVPYLAEVMGVPQKDVATMLTQSKEDSDADFWQRVYVATMQRPGGAEADEAQAAADAAVQARRVVFGQRGGNALQNRMQPAPVQPNAAEAEPGYGARAGEAVGAAINALRGAFSPSSQRMPSNAPPLPAPGAPMQAQPGVSTPPNLGALSPPAERTSPIPGRQSAPRQGGGRPSQDRPAVGEAGPPAAAAPRQPVPRQEAEPTPPADERDAKFSGDYETIGGKRYPIFIRPDGTRFVDVPDAAGGGDEYKTLQQARDAIAQGADKSAVEDLLRDMGVDPSRL